MSTVLPTDERLGPEPDLTLPDWPEIDVIAKRRWEHDGDGTKKEHYFPSPTRLYLRYDGWLEDILGAGIITAAMAVPPGKGHYHCDPNGRNVRIARRWKTKDGQPLQYLSVERKLHPDELPRWPLALEALAAYDRYWARKDARYRCFTEHPRADLPGHQAPRRGQPFLRLVVNNPRKARHELP